MTTSDPAGRPGRRGRGELPAALVDAGREQLAQAGPGGFSVAEVARRVGVSTAAPYRHFDDRDHFLAAVVASEARELTSAVHAATQGVEADDERLAAAAGAYAAAVAVRKVGFDLIFAPALRRLRDEDLAQAGRALVAAFFDPALAVAATPQAALELVEQVVTLAHGYAALDQDAFLTADRVTSAPTAERAARAARALIRGSAL